jgi:hypothetical protein
MDGRSVVLLWETHTSTRPNISCGPGCISLADGREASGPALSGVFRFRCFEAVAAEDGDGSTVRDSVLSRSARVFGCEETLSTMTNLVRIYDSVTSRDSSSAIKIELSDGLGGSPNAL